MEIWTVAALIVTSTRTGGLVASVFGAAQDLNHHETEE
jgi:hypothetical protein